MSGGRHSIDSEDTSVRKIGNPKLSGANRLTLTDREAWCLNYVIAVALEQPDIFGPATVERSVFAAQLMRIQRQLPKGRDET